MPLLHRRAFSQQKPPADLRPDEEVFLCKITHEIFRTYEEFFERTILCNSLVWSCALTGRAGLTYLEAVESERRARQSLQSIEPALVVPLLHLAALSRCCRLSQLCEDIYTFVKDRFFPGEWVEVTFGSGDRHKCEILEVHSPHASANGAPISNGHSKQAESDVIVISDSDDDSVEFQPPAPRVSSSQKKKSLGSSAFRYTVRRVMDKHGQLFTVKAPQISRMNVLSRERLKLLFKQHCEPQSGTIVPKKSTVRTYGLAGQTFSQFFPDEPPLFPFRPTSKGAGDCSSGQTCSLLLKATEEKLKLLQQRQEMEAALQEKTRLKKEKEEAQEYKKREREDKDKVREDKDKVKEEQRRRFEEEKQQRREEKERQKLEKEREREKMKEEKKKYAEQRKLWNKRREDMECEDLKELPCPVPVRTRLPAELFGDALMILEFLQAFGDFFDLKDEFPEGVSLEVLEEALVGSDPEGPLCELLFFFLSAIFQALAEEQEEVAKEQTEDLSEALDDDSDPTKSALSAVASLAAAWPQLHQGCSLKQLDLDSCTLSEILRLHILASGSDCSHGNAKFRYQKQGGFTVMDDPCVELRLAEPVLLKKLACTSVYDLTSGEKLHILQALAGKLLTLASCRDLIEDCLEEQKAARQEVREIRAEQHRREREETAHRIRLRKEEKIKEQMQRLKLREQEVKGEHQMNSQCAALNSETPAEWNTEEGEETTSPTNQQKVKAEVDLKGKEPQQQRTSEPKPSSCPTAEELQNEQEKVQALQELIQKAAARTCLQPLGRDRLYRRYWLLPSAAALFVEDDCFGLTEDMLQPAASSVPDSSTNMEDKEGEKEELAGERSCLAPTCSGGLPLSRPNRWSLYSSVEEVDQLIKALNPRGDRESRLKEALQQERPRLQQVLQHSDKNKYNHTESTQSDPESPVSAEALMEMRLRDLLLDIEDRIHQGGLGTLKVMDRQVWRLALDAGNYELHCSDGSESGGMNGQLSAMEMDSTRARDRLHELKTNGAATSSGSATPQAVSSTVRSLAHTLLQIEHGIERRFLQAPLGDEDSRKDQKTKKNKKKDEDQASDDGSESGHVVRTVLERWRESLQSCTSLSQVFIHLSSLERSVLWSRSVLNARCRICRRKGDADNMLLCDGCDRGHHTHCLRPRLKSVPEGDWFCPDCRPKQKSSRLPSRQRSSVDEEEDNSDEVVQEESEEESEEVVSTKKTQTLNPKGKGQQATPKGQQATPKGQQAMPKGQQATPKGQQATPKGPQAALQNNIVSAGKNSSVSRTSGKKSTPPSSKTPPRSRSQSDNHLRVKTLASNGNAKTSADRSSCRKRPQADVTPPSKPSRLIPSSAPTSSSSRRSSGRNQGVHELSACEQLTVELVRHEDSWPFMKLVSRTQVPDYYDIIKKPIALSTIREKVNNCEYKTAGEYVADVELMFTNCLLYNHHHTNEAQAGQRLQLFFHDELHKVGLSDCGFIPPSKRSRH